MNRGTTEKKNTKRTCYGFGAFLAVFLSVALVLTSFDFTVMVVHAEEGDGSDQETEEPKYVTNDEGAIIIDSFQPLNDDVDKQITLDQKGTLAEVTVMMPSSIWVNVTKEISEPPVESSSGAGSETPSGSGESSDAESSGVSSEPSSDSGEPSGGESSGDGGTTAPDSGEPSGAESSGDGGTTTPDNGEPSGGESSGEGDTTPSDSGEPSSEEPSEGNGGAPAEDDSQGQDPEENDPGDIEPEMGDAPVEEPAEKDIRDRQWPTARVQDTGRGDGVVLLSEGGIVSPDSPEDPSPEPTEESSTESPEESSTESPEESSTESPEESPAESSEESSAESSEESSTEPTEALPSNPAEVTPSAPTEANPPVIKYKRTADFIQIPVTWKCVEDYDNTNLDSYTFRPEWDENNYVYEGDQSGIPEITVTISRKAPGTEVSTQAELQDALNNGDERIVMTADIPLTSSLSVPASYTMELDGGGFSLLRGDTDGVKFTGAMMVVEGAAEGEEGSDAVFTLTNLRINGRTDGSDDNNKAEAPAVIVHGNLVLEEGARVEGNYNYGSKDVDGEYTVRPVGGGLLVCVRGRLRIREGASVENNFAEEAGGGVYLEESDDQENRAGLYLHGDVIRNNKAGIGGDLYAAAGSFVSYALSIDLESKNGGGSYYIDPEATVFELGPDKPPVVNPPETVEGNVEVFLSVHRDSGYSDAEIAQLTEALKEKGITVITPGRTDIDTTDLRNWYVYDHYEPLQWGGQNIASVTPQAWTDMYGGNPKRSYYPYLLGYNPTYAFTPKNGNSVNTIEEWLGRQKDYTTSYYGLCLAQFKEHIYSGKQDGLPQMTFVGYGSPAYVDFLYYDPESNGEKVVNFDVDSAKVKTHTLAGTGFLVNAGVDNDGKMHGYLVYYTYTNEQANSISLYNLDGVNAAQMHHNEVSFLINQCTSVTIQPSDWETEMSIQIVATPESIKVRQQPKNAEGSIDQTEPVLTYNIPDGERDNAYSGFGPLVAYSPHGCPMASAFTYSNLRMYFTNPVLEREDMLTPLQEADYTQAGNQRYFLNIFGNSGLEYNEGANFGQYQELLYIMQNEGVALITDRDTPFGDYLGTNLQELDRDGGSRISIEELVDQTVLYIADKQEEGTKLDTSKLTPAEPKQSVGNISLRSELDGSQFRTLKAPADKYYVQIDASLSYAKDDAEPSYGILKPGAPGYATLEEPRFTVTNDEKEWPAGQYTVRQRFPASSIYGYSYFTLIRDTPASQPTITPEKPTSQAAYESEASEDFSQGEEPPVTRSEATPKTGDRRLPPMPVAMGACTVFMLKLILWMYEMEMGITDQVKDEMLRALIDWAKGTTRPRILLALAAISVVLVIYHLFKEINARRKRLAVKRREK